MLVPHLRVVLEGIQIPGYRQRTSKTCIHNLVHIMLQQLLIAATSLGMPLRCIYAQQTHACPFAVVEGHQVYDISGLQQQL